MTTPSAATAQQQPSSKPQRRSRNKARADVPTKAATDQFCKPPAAKAASNGTASDYDLAHTQKEKAPELQQSNCGGSASGNPPTKLLQQALAAAVSSEITGWEGKTSWEVENDKRHQQQLAATSQAAKKKYVDVAHSGSAKPAAAAQTAYRPKASAKQPAGGADAFPPLPSAPEMRTASGDTGSRPQGAAASGSAAAAEDRRVGAAAAGQVKASVAGPAAGSDHSRPVTSTALPGEMSEGKAALGGASSCSKGIGGDIRSLPDSRRQDWVPKPRQGAPGSRTSSSAPSSGGHAARAAAGVSGAAGDSSASLRPGSAALSSAVLEQQWLENAKAAAAGTSSMISGIARPTTADAVMSSGGSVRAAVGVFASTRKSAMLLQELADALQAEQQAWERQQSDFASKQFELLQQQQRDAAARAAAEKKAAELEEALDAARKAAQEFEAKLSLQSSQVDTLKSDFATAMAAKHEACKEAAAAHGQVSTLQQQLGELEAANLHLRQQLNDWQRSYAVVERENGQMRHLLGTNAPAPGSLPPAVALPSAPAAAGSGSDAVSDGSFAGSKGGTVASSGAKAPPPGFGPVAPAPVVCAAQPEQQQVYIKNEHELVLTILPVLREGVDNAVQWTAAELAAVNAQLVPLSWEGNYEAVYGSIDYFMQQRPAVFGCGADVASSGSSFQLPMDQQRLPGPGPASALPAAPAGGADWGQPLHNRATGPPAAVAAHHAGMMAGPPPVSMALPQQQFWPTSMPASAHVPVAMSMPAAAPLPFTTGVMPYPYTNTGYRNW
eukprot:gene12094-12233_t